MCYIMVWSSVPLMCCSLYLSKECPRINDVESGCRDGQGSAADSWASHAAHDVGGGDCTRIVDPSPVDWKISTALSRTDDDDDDDERIAWNSLWPTRSEGREICSLRTSPEAEFRGRMLWSWGERAYLGWRDRIPQRDWQDPRRKLLRREHPDPRSAAGIAGSPYSNRTNPPTFPGDLLSIQSNRKISVPYYSDSDNKLTKFKVDNWPEKGMDRSTASTLVSPPK